MTLLEVLLAIVILVMVVSMVSLSLSGTFKVASETRSMGDVYHRAQVTMLRLSEDLASAVVSEDLDFPGEEKANILSQQI